MPSGITSYGVGVRNGSKIAVAVRQRQRRPVEVDEVYRGYRIAIKKDHDVWVARVTRVEGTLAPITATASAMDGAKACLLRARRAVDEYIAYLGSLGGPT